MLDPVSPGRPGTSFEPGKPYNPLRPADTGVRRLNIGQEHLDYDEF